MKILLLIVAVLAVTALVYGITVAGRGRHTRKALLAEARAPWAHYARPDENGNWRIGVARTSPITGMTLERIELYRAVRDGDAVERVLLIEQAKLLAADYNTAGEGFRT